MRVITIAITVGLLVGELIVHVPRAHGQAPPGDKAAGAPTPAAGAPTPATPGKPTKIQYSGKAMGTIVTMWLWTADERAAAQAAEAVFAEMKRLDNEMTTWERKPKDPPAGDPPAGDPPAGDSQPEAPQPEAPPSEVVQINKAAGSKPVKVSAETFAVIERAIDVSKRSKGLFDITVEAFKGVWKFDEDMDKKLPDPAEVKKRLALVNWKNVVLDAKQHTVFLKHKGMAITLGGIAKGYAVDKCVEILRQRGFSNFMMQAGGDMYIAGKKGTDPWMVAIRDPRGEPNTYFAAAPIEDHSFSTSGDYERGFVKDGVRYHHIIDTRTGEPARASRSVTVRAKDAFTADAWSKVMFIMGPKDALELIKREKLTDFEVVWVDDQNRIVTTDGIKPVLKILKEPTAGP